VSDGLELGAPVASKISEMYAKRGRMSEALRVFRAMPERDAVSFGAMIDALASSSSSSSCCCSSSASCALPEGGCSGGLALELFAEMKEAGIAPSKAVFLSVLKACQQKQKQKQKQEEALLLRRCREVHAEIVERGFDADVEIGSALTSTYSKRRRLDEAARAFGALEAPNLVAWTALIAGHVSCDRNAEAIALYTRMTAAAPGGEEAMRPDAVLYAAMLTAFANAGAHAPLLLLHSELVKAGLDDDGGDEILRARLRGERACYAGSPCLPACTSTVGSDGGLRAAEGDLIRGEQLSFCSSCSALDELSSGLGLFAPGLAVRRFGSAADALGRAGLVQEAECLVRTMPFPPDAVAWTALLCSCRVHGAARLASACFRSLSARVPPL
jgi:hypothetical protein